MYIYIIIPAQFLHIIRRHAKLYRRVYKLVLLMWKKGWTVERKTVILYPTLYQSTSLLATLSQLGIIVKIHNSYRYTVQL